MLPQFSSSRARTLWVQAQLKNIGSSFAEIARELDCERSTVSDAMHMASDRQEKAIAKKLGVTQQALFPERYGEGGKRLHAVKNSPSRHPRNVKESRERGHAA